MTKKLKITIALSIFAAIALCILSMPFLNKLAKAPGRERLYCETNLNQLYKVLLEYTGDNEGRFPRPEKWNDLLNGYRNNSDVSFLCPSQKGDSENRCDYAMNTNLEGKLFSEVAEDVVLLFESDRSWNTVGSEKQMDFGNHSYLLETTTCGILLSDGSVIFPWKGDTGRFNWGNY